jgi:L-aminopeptidase/D-esterase-like protein
MYPSAFFPEERVLVCGGDLVTPVASGVAHLLREWLKNEMVCKDDRIDEFVAVAKPPFSEAVKAALSEERAGPGITGF